MKTLLFILLSLNCFSQEKDAFFDRRGLNENKLYVMQGWYNWNGLMKSDSEISVTKCYFSYRKYYNYVTLKIQSKEPILSPIFIFTYKGQYSLIINQRISEKDVYGVYYYSLLELNFSNTELWQSLDSGIKRIEFFTGNQWYIIRINNNLNKIKNYGAH